MTRPWAAICTTCGHVARSATEAGARLLADSHAATGHVVGVTYTKEA